MKRIILILFLNFFSILVYGQTPTYTMEVSFSGRFFCPYNQYHWTVFSNGFSQSNNDIATPDFQYDVTDKIYTDVKMNSSYSLSLLANSFVEPCLSATDECNSNSTISATAISLITFPNLRLGGCDFTIGISEFKPNLTIQKSNPSTLEVCSGEMLDLYALPAGFPNVAYHWQYSLDNQITWIDVPAGFNDMTPNSNFSMQDILGSSHLNYWGKTIHFRLGYDQNRPFTNAIAIKYLPCAPIVKSITCLEPKCSGENIQDLKVTFDRDLLQGERLENFAVIKTDGTLSTIGVPLITTFQGTDPLNKYFSIKNFTGLENGKTYSVKYQAFQDTKERGVITTDSTFSYKEPAKLTFNAEIINPLCHEGQGTIDIKTKGGSGDYYYSFDGTNYIKFDNSTAVDTLGNRSGAQSTSVNVSDIKKDFNINVKDTNDCIGTVQ
jgi:hypothetical protein